MTQHQSSDVTFNASASPAVSTEVMAPQPPALIDDVLRDIFREAGGRHLFAWYLIKRNDIFTMPEKVNKNVCGGGKDRKSGLDTAKVNLVKYLTFK